MFTLPPERAQRVAEVALWPKPLWMPLRGRLLLRDVKLETSYGRHTSAQPGGPCRRIRQGLPADGLLVQPGLRVYRRGHGGHAAEGGQPQAEDCPHPGQRLDGQRPGLSQQGTRGGGQKATQAVDRGRPALGEHLRLLDRGHRSVLHHPSAPGRGRGAEHKLTQHRGRPALSGTGQAQ